jgi:opacity protein-like surface antigen
LVSFFAIKQFCKKTQPIWLTYKKEKAFMKKLIKLVEVFFVVCLCFLVSIASAESAKSIGTNTGPQLIVVQETTIPLGTKAEKSSGETECPYKLTLKINALFLHRGDNKSQSLRGVLGVSWGSLLAADDFNLGWAPGMDTSLMFRNQNFGVEVRYLGLTQWSESKTATTNFNANPAGIDFTASGKFKSALNNAELNLHWWPCANDRYNLLMGFRWLRLKDRFSLFERITISSSLSSANDGMALSCRNDLWGGQVGVEGLLFGKRDQGFSIDYSVKGGVFENRISNKAASFLEQNDIAVDSNSDSWDRTKTAFLSELGLNANYAFTKNIALSIGYELLYVNKAAVAIQDASTQSVLFQGGRAGLHIAF